MGHSPQQVDQLLEELHQEAKSFFRQPVATDWLCVFIDAKIIELKDEHDEIKKGVHFLVIGIGLDGKKDVISASTFSEPYWGSRVMRIKSERSLRSNLSRALDGKGKRSRAVRIANNAWKPADGTDSPVGACQTGGDKGFQTTSGGFL